MPASDIVVQGAREHNLRDVSLVLPRNQLICLTGVSGSGKSSLAFDTLYAEAQRNGWIEAEELVDEAGVQLSAIGYPHLPRTEIYRSVDEVYRRFYFRPRKMLSLGAAMLRDRELMRRRIQEGRDFLRFLRKHRTEAPIGA